MKVLKRVVISLVIAVVAIALAPGAATAKPSAHKRAVNAVKNEVRTVYSVLYGKKVNVGCSRLSARKFTCSFRARVLKERLTGRARVTVYRYGAEARLFQTKCYTVSDVIDECYLLTP